MLTIMRFSVVPIVLKELLVWEGYCPSKGRKNSCQKIEKRQEESSSNENPCGWWLHDFLITLERV